MRGGRGRLTQVSTIYLLIKLSLSLYNKVCTCILILDSYFLSSLQMVIRKKFGLRQLLASSKILFQFFRYLFTFWKEEERGSDVATI